LFCRKLFFKLIDIVKLILTENKIINVKSWLSLM
jgi:hypothetical protein